MKKKRPAKKHRHSWPWRPYIDGDKPVLLLYRICACGAQQVKFNRKNGGDWPAELNRTL